ncbi:uncharacterized protein RJT21DRAFT_123388 [Scheffersomyces amazonensis]|uniref:uncharacterized protein n=1 Tax=Scheffersomyces amazonensis TaxID=1078765 RepID=UPI00315CB8AB
MPETHPFPSLTSSETITGPNQEHISNHRFFNIGTFFLSVYGSLRLLFSHHGPHNNSEEFLNNETPFSSSIIIVLSYWSLFYLLQLGYLYQFPSNLRASLEVDWHLSLFNFGHFLWTVFYIKSWYFLAEVVLLLNLLNSLIVYFNHQTYKYRPFGGDFFNWLFVHLPATVFPLGWLLYAIFWNGAILFGIHEFVGRVISNILIWDFLIVPLLFLLLFGDWAVALTQSYFMLGVGIGQLFTKLFALQWIFAFVISGVLFVFSILVAITGGLPDDRRIPILEDVERRTGTGHAEGAPLLGNN